MGSTMVSDLSRKIVITGSTGFNIASLSPALWLKADAGLFQDSAKTIPAVSDGDPVGAWADQSTNGRDLLQTIAGSRPSLKIAAQNGRNVVRFDGVDDRMLATFTLAAPMTIFTVARTTTGGQECIYDGVDASNRLFFVQGGGGANVVSADGLQYAANSPMGLFQSTIIVNGASTQAYRDGVFKATGSPSAGTTIAGMIIGSTFTPNAFLNGDIHELLLIQRLVTADERVNIESGYLKPKWGTP